MGMEDLELLRAALSLALADGDLRRSERGVIEGLARRVGVGRVSFDAMLAEAESNKSIPDNILIHNPAKAAQAFEVLVAQARLDGEISSHEREVLVRIAAALRIAADDFTNLYEAGIRRADALRKRRAPPG